MTILLAPFAPHIASEAWEILGLPGTLSSAGWPEFDSELAREDEVQIVVQINGKVRSKFMAPAEIPAEEMKTMAVADSRIASLIEGKTVRKVITVPGKLVNLVVSG
jgi:leucyl-tRNA synthetase